MNENDVRVRTPTPEITKSAYKKKFTASALWIKLNRFINLSYCGKTICLFNTDKMILTIYSEEYTILPK